MRKKIIVHNDHDPLGYWMVYGCPNTRHYHWAKNFKLMVPKDVSKYEVV